MSKRKKAVKKPNVLRSLAIVSMVIGIILAIFGFILFIGSTYFLSNYNFALGAPIAFVGMAFMFVGGALTIIGFAVWRYLKTGETSRYMVEQTAPAVEKNTEAGPKVSQEV